MNGLTSLQPISSASSSSSSTEDEEYISMSQIVRYPSTKPLPKITLPSNYNRKTNVNSLFPIRKPIVRQYSDNSKGDTFGSHTTKTSRIKSDNFDMNNRYSPPIKSFISLYGTQQQQQQRQQPSTQNFNVRLKPINPTIRKCYPFPPLSCASPQRNTRVFENGSSTQRQHSVRQNGYPTMRTNNLPNPLQKPINPNENRNMSKNKDVMKSDLSRNTNHHLMKLQKEAMKVAAGYPTNRNLAYKLRSKYKGTLKSEGNKILPSPSNNGDKIPIPTTSFRENTQRHFTSEQFDKLEDEILSKEENDLLANQLTSLTDEHLDRLENLFS